MAALNLMGNDFSVKENRMRSKIVFVLFLLLIEKLVSWTLAFLKIVVVVNVLFMIMARIAMDTQ